MKINSIRFILPENNTVGNDFKLLCVKMWNFAFFFCKKKDHVCMFACLFFPGGYRIKLVTAKDQDGAHVIGSQKF